MNHLTWLILPDVLWQIGVTKLNRWPPNGRSFELRTPEEAKSRRGDRGTIQDACRGSRATWHIVVVSWPFTHHGQILVPSFECLFSKRRIMLWHFLSLSTWTPRFVPGQSMFAQPERRAWVSGNFAEEFALKLQQEAAMATGADGTAFRMVSECLCRCIFLCCVRFCSCLHVKGTGST